MFVVAFIWVLFCGIAIGVGVEKEETWQYVFKVGSGVDKIRRGLLILGGIISAATIVASFYYFVLKNALIIFVTWVVAFLLVRVIIEILLRRSIGDDSYTAQTKGPKPKIPPQAEPTMPSPVTPEEPQPEIELRDAEDAEEIESNTEFASQSFEPRTEISENATTADLPTSTPLSSRGASVISKPQLGPTDPRGTEYNEIFDRINSESETK